MLLRSLALLVVLTGSFGVATAASFTPIPGVTTTGVSGDGSVVVGNSGAQAVRWTAAGGATPLVSPGDRVTAVGVAADGAAVVGTFFAADGNNVCPFEMPHPFRWTAQDGTIELVPAPDVDKCYFTAGVAPDGATVFLERHVNEDNAYRWTAAGGLEPLGPAFPFPGTFVEAASYDGSVAVGWAKDDGLPALAVRWLGGSMLPLGVEGTADAVSWDGSIVFGRGPEGVFRWTEADGVVPIGFFGTPVGVTGDGLVLITEDSIWEATLGLRALPNLLASTYGLGPVLTGWNLGIAVGISADGLAIIGNGINPSGERAGWIAIIPEPSSLPLLAAGLAGLAALSRARS